MGSSILSEVDNTLDLRMGLSNPPALSCQLASALSALAPAQRAGGVLGMLSSLEVKVLYPT